MGSAAEPRLYGGYQGSLQFESSWRELAASIGAREQVVGRSVEGRDLWRFDLGSQDPKAPVIFLSALIHGIELIGSVALFDVVRRLKPTASARAADLLASARLVLMPMVNPDALAENMSRLERGYPAWRRTNAHGVDLNRNFPAAEGASNLGSWHPFSGSRFRFSPHYRGPHPLSEPESQAVARVVEEVKPGLSLGFHSFGNMLLFPWAFSRQANPRAARYQSLSRQFARALPGLPYVCKQAIDFYPTVGDLDDWLDSRHGALAFTVEVSALDGRLMNPLRFVNPFCWMNPSRIEPTVSNVSPGIISLLESALGLPAND